ncbi:MAG: type III secretion inner membrane ring lipoprotein SctJ [Burkholderiaceae bacterium]|nr:type III secretion inner membrane ring lipoprotein SctJ [Burkholderiaceae bacterium]
MTSSLHRLLLAATLLLLAACQKDLHTALSEPDANEALAVLLAAGVDAEKITPDNGKTWTLRVPEGAIVQSLELLRARGLPRSAHSNLGEMFKKDGLISTPVEERVRFVHGTSQELAETLSRMDGVVTARVHIVLPNNDPLAREIKPSSASVFIKHRADAAVANMTAPVKNLVAHSVEGLTYDNVSVTFVPADPVSPQLLMNTGSPRTGLLLPLVLMGALAMVLASAALLVWTWLRPRQAEATWAPLGQLARRMERLRRADPPAPAHADAGGTAPAGPAAPATSGAATTTGAAAKAAG